MKARRSSPTKLAIAFVFLAVGGWFFVQNLLGEFGAKGGPGSMLSIQDPSDEEDLTEIPAGTKSVDLLAVVGSCDLLRPVPTPFLMDPRFIPASPGAGDLNADSRPASDKPKSSDPNAPPPMTISLILRAGDAQRAVVDNRVVGIGDSVAAGTVKRIAAEGIEIEMVGGRSWFYTIQAPYPLGYEAPREGEGAPEHSPEDRD